MEPKMQPYVGPRSFERKDKAIFYGRDKEARDLFSLIIANNVVLVYSPSGAGKTSLLNAKLIPLLENEGFEVLPLARVRNITNTQINSKKIHNIYVFNTLMNWYEGNYEVERHAEMSFEDFLNERSHKVDDDGFPSPRAIIFDQFEELFTGHLDRWRERDGFFEQISRALKKDSLLRIVFVMREDHIAKLDPYVNLLPETLIRFHIDRMRREAALLAVKGPLKITDKSFAEGVAEKLVEDLLRIRIETRPGETDWVSGEFAEALQLQVVCQNLWQELTENDNEYWFRWKEIPGNDSVRLIEFLTQKYDIDWVKTAIIEKIDRDRTIKITDGKNVISLRLNKEYKYLFNWDKIPGNDNGILLEFLTKKFGIDWIKKAKIEKIENGMTIIVTAGKNYIYLSLNDEKSKVNLKIDDGRIDEFITTAENNELNIYNEQTKINIEIGDSRTDEFIVKTENGKQYICDNQITLDHIEKYGTIDQALSKFYDDAIQATKTSVDEERMRKWFEEVLITSMGTRGTVYRGPQSTGGISNSVIDILEDMHLIRADWRAGARWYELTHDRFIDPIQYSNNANRLKKEGIFEIEYERAIAYKSIIDAEQAWGLKYYDESIQKYQKAITIYKKIEDFNRLAETLSSYALLLQKLNRIEEAEEHYKKAIQANPKYSNGHLNYANLLLKLIRIEEAEEHYKKAIQTNPKYFEAHLNYANLLLKLNRIEEAEEHYKKAIQTNPKYSEAHLSYALLLQKLNRIEEAEEHYKKAIQTKPKYSEAHLNYVNLLLKLNRIEEAAANIDAMKFLKELAEKNPDSFLPEDASTQNNFGILYTNIGRFEDAEKAYTEALKIRKELAEKNPDSFLPEVASTQNNLGNLYSDLNRFEDAEKAFTEALKIYKKQTEKSPIAYLPDVAMTQNNLGNLYRNIGRFEDAEKAFIEALKFCKELAEKSIDAYLPDVATTQNNIGILYRNIGRFEDAEKAFTEALKFCKELAEKSPDVYLPDVATTQNNLGNLYSNLNRFEDAEKAFIEALKINKELAEKNPDAYLPDVAMTRNNLGNLYRDFNRFEDAEKAYTEALKIRKDLES